MVQVYTDTLPLPALLIRKLKATPQNPCFHAEGDVFNHTMMVLKEVLALDDSWKLTEEERLILYWTAVLHDIGKPEVTRWEEGRFHSHGHEKAGIPIARDILLTQKNVTDFQRKTILDLVRWHSIPLKYGLRKEKLDAYKLLATQVDMRLLGIFAYCDLRGRICEKPVLIEKLMKDFNEQILFQVQETMGSHSELQSLYANASIYDKNKLWAASTYTDARLLEQVLQTLSVSAASVPGSQRCILPIGVASKEMEIYLNKHYAQAVKVPVSKHQNFSDEKVLKIFQGEEQLLFDGDFTDGAWRRSLCQQLRDQGKEICCLFFEIEKDRLLEGLKNPVEYTEVMKTYSQLESPHPWEAHQIEFIRL